jgi:hypothetical protein
MNDQLSSEIVSPNIKFASARKLSFSFFEKASAYQRTVRCGFLLALAFFTLASSALAQPTMSRGEKLLPISYNECMQRAEQAYLAEGWVNLGKGGAFIYAYKESNGAYITCNVAPENKTWANIFVASNSGDSGVPGGERVKLKRRMEQPSSSGDCVIPTISGVYTTFGDPVGVMVIDRQIGNYISARYGKDENSLVNQMEGNFNCNVLKGNFTNTVYNSRGTFEYRFAADGSSFAGTWWNSGGGSGNTSGTKRMALYRN